MSKILPYSREKLGGILILLGVCAWIPYGILKYGLDREAVVYPFLVWHLAGVIPGFLLRRWGLLKRIVSGMKDS